MLVGSMLLGVVATLLGASLLLATAYLLLLTLAALLPPRARRRPDAKRRRFAILVPAHDEELLIGRLLANLQTLRYPRHAFDIHVVADHCTDRTAAVAEAFDCIVHVRTDSAERAKGYALRWLLERLREQGQLAQYDAIVVVDADSVLSANFLESMNVHLAGGSQVVQAYYSVLNAGRSPVAGLRYAALAAVHYLRPSGRSALGLSVGLKGNGMCFTRPILERFTWNWFTLAEDVEFHLALVQAGARVDFAPDAIVLADMPESFAQAASQNDRWERGRIQLLRTRVSALVSDGLRKRSAVRLDAAIEQFLPPLSISFALAALCLSEGLLLGQVWPAVLGMLSLGGQVVYLLAALASVRAPWRVYAMLSYAPLYIGWKVALYVRVLLNPRSGRWVRTARVS